MCAQCAPNAPPMQALLAYMTPEYDEIARVSICPYNIVTGESSDPRGGVRSDHIHQIWLEPEV